MGVSILGIVLATTAHDREAWRCMEACFVRAASARQ